jgi:hypothetical protein
MARLQNGGLHCNSRVILNSNMAVRLFTCLEAVLSGKGEGHLIRLISFDIPV